MGVASGLLEASGEQMTCKMECTRVHKSAQESSGRVYKSVQECTRVQWEMHPGQCIYLPSLSGGDFTLC